MTPEETTVLAEAAVEAVREASRQGRLVTSQDVLAALEADGTFLAPVGLESKEQPPLAEDLCALLAGILAESQEIASFESLSGGRTLYHAPALLSRTYARILDRKGFPLQLMVEEIRSNSRDYPRPVPVELFEAPPFDLTPEEIEHALKALAASPDHQDITFTTAPTGALYLFSTLHLERGYATFLAQRAESLVMNP
ncbi:MAG: hypothetical protein Q8O35_04325 [Humidesulfovibrio sp.]|uniref:hypothetical protein n=1 Tax=Humidesulfovibrio sp. TaxID=2910988 RepID=UPI00273728FA|nr:hypothetical protein [Humidesulfovibrio sp.]MDP2847400.1 hypothetical protein [Humidesulfovibrio sp.]